MSTTWIAVIVVVVVLFFLNGSLAYLYRSRQMRSQGKVPPSYLRYMFFPVSFYSRVPMPRPLRWALGLIVLGGGVLIILLGAVLAVIVDLSQIPHPVGAVVAFSVFILLGAAIGYVGLRMLRMKHENDPLLGVTRKWRIDPSDTPR